MRERSRDSRVEYFGFCGGALAESCCGDELVIEEEVELSDESDEKDIVAAVL